MFIVSFLGPLHYAIIVSIAAAVFQCIVDQCCDRDDLEERYPRSIHEGLKRFEGFGVGKVLLRINSLNRGQAHLVLNSVWEVPQIGKDDVDRFCVSHFLSNFVALTPPSLPRPARPVTGAAA